MQYILTYMHLDGLLRTHTVIQYNIIGNGRSKKTITSLHYLLIGLSKATVTDPVLTWYKAQATPQGSDLFPKLQPKQDILLNLGLLCHLTTASSLTRT